MSKGQRPLFGALVSALLVSGCAHQELPKLPNEYLQVTEQIALAGPVAQENIAQLKRDKYLIIDLRTSAEEGQTEQQQGYQRAGVSYQHLPVQGATVTSEHVSALTRHLSDHSSSPVIIQCASGNRAALLWAAYRIDQGESAASAETAVAPLATKAAVIDAIRVFASEHEQANPNQPEK
ncbi:MAG: sulfur transferase domain-containing protein [Pseudomonadales bacterium]